MELQTEYLGKMQTALENDRRIQAAWLTGSIGRGNADRYSDIDINLLVDATQLDAFRKDAQQWLNELSPLVLFRWMFNDRMANALTANGLRIDLWLHTDVPTLDESRVKVLLNRENALQFGATTPAPDSNALKNRLLDQIREFWRCISLTPSVVGRGERLVGVFGLGIEVTILTDVIIGGYGIARDSGVKRLNPFLPDGLRQRLEEAVAMDGLTDNGLLQAHMALAGIMQDEGRKIAERHGFDYPSDVETAALAYTKQEMSALGMAV